ncbi:gamma-glutamylcyclotransferase [Mucilaginibacter litoreus]|uniref:Gamma-glutamylcyclotransferase n=1 Tax=Mucilaginibacter litoreus TaxID=1048221 RepID=A0ABW3AS20_9SPHI
MTSLLFVYGTLLQTDNDFAAYLRANCTFVSTGKINGELYDLGDYPGLVLTDLPDEFVYGSIYKMDNVDGVLKQLDWYEGVGPNEEQPNLYIRQKVIVNSADGDAAEAWVYIYNRSIANLYKITDGDYINYLNKKSPNLNKAGD